VRVTPPPPQSGVEKVIVNMVNSDYGIQDTVVQVTGPLEAESEDERGVVLVAWNLDSDSHGWDFAYR